MEFVYATYFIEKTCILEYIRRFIKIFTSAIFHILLAPGWANPWSPKAEEENYDKYILETSKNKLGVRF